MDWNRFLAVPLEQLPFYLIAILIAFTVHEFAHAYFANRFGDPTARLLGRMTLNPAVHVDFFGVLLLIIAGFGWARPVPVNRANFSNPRLMSIIVSAAGPISNLLLGIFGAFLYAVMFATGAFDAIGNDRLLEGILIFFRLFIFMNFVLFLFNLIPLPPLDGYRIVDELAPRSLQAKMQQFEQWAVFLFLLIIFIPGLRVYTIEPLFAWADRLYFGFIRLFATMMGI